MRKILIFSIFAWLSAMPATAQSFQIGPAQLALGSDLEVYSCEDCTSFETEKLLLWTPVLSDVEREKVVAFREALDGFDPFEDAEDIDGSKTMGTVRIVWLGDDGGASGTTPQERHRELCNEFRLNWGGGFEKFDAETEIGHCATFAGALNYAMCRYFDEGILCASGLDEVELMKWETHMPFGARAVLAEHAETGSEAGSEYALTYMYAVAMVPQIQRLLGSAQMAGQARD